MVTNFTHLQPYGDLFDKIIFAEDMIVDGTCKEHFVQAISAIRGALDIMMKRFTGHMGLDDRTILSLVPSSDSRVNLFSRIDLYSGVDWRTIRREEWKEPDFSYYVYEKDAWRAWDEDQREWGAVRDAIRSGKYGDIEVMLYDEANRYCVDFASYTDLRKKHTYMTWFVPENSFDYIRQDPEYNEVLIDPKGKLRVGDDWEYLSGGEYGGEYGRDSWFLWNEWWDMSFDRRYDNDGWWYYYPFEPEYWGYKRGPIEGTVINSDYFDTRAEQSYAERGAGYYVTFDYESNHWIGGYYIGNRSPWRTYDYDDGVNRWYVYSEDEIAAGFVHLPEVIEEEPSEP